MRNIEKLPTPPNSLNTTTVDSPPPVPSLVSTFLWLSLLLNLLYI